MRRQRILLIAVLVLGALALGRWLMLVQDAVDAQPTPAAPVPAELAPAASTPPPVADGVPVNEEQAQPPAGAILRGRVMDAATREPVRKFTLQFHWARSTGYREMSPARTFDTDDGRFEWADATPGVWTIIASARGYQRLELEEFQLQPGAATPQIVIPLRRGHEVTGRIYDEASGIGIAAARINFRESQVGRFEGNWRIRDQLAARSRKDGSFVLESVPAGRITLSAYADGYAGREVEVVVGDETAPAEIALFIGGSISGRLTAADGITPIAGSAGIFRLDEEYGGSGPTNESGEFSFGNLPAGRYKITGQADQGSAERMIKLAANERVEGIVLALGGGHAIRGFVTGLRPEALERVSITWNPDGDHSGGSFALGERVDANGAYELRGVPPGRVRITADVQAERQFERIVEMPANTDLNVNIELPRGGRLSGRVTHGGKPVSGAWIAPHQQVAQDGVFIYGTRTNANGEYVIEDMPPGEYFLRIERYRSAPFEVTADDLVFNVDVPAAQLSGRLLEATGKAPIVGADLRVWSATDPLRNRQYGTSDHFGHFVLSGMEPGEVILSAYKPGYEMYRERMSYNASTPAMTIRLRQDKGIPARARDAASGRPIGETDVYVAEEIGEVAVNPFQVHFDTEGVGYFPRALAGSTLSLGIEGYEPVVIREWDGAEIDLRLTPQRAVKTR